MLPVRPGWGPENYTEYTEIPYKTLRFLIILIISGTLTMTAGWPAKMKPDLLVRSNFLYFGLLVFF